MKKYILGISVTVIAAVAFIALLPLQAFFSGDGELQKLSDGDTVSIEVEVPQAAGEQVSSLQLSLALSNKDGSPADASVLENIQNLSFAPDEAVTSKTEVWEERYHEDTGILDIYIAGTESLFSEEDKLAVGSLSAEIGAADDVYIKVVEDSFKIVKGISLETVSDEQDAVMFTSKAQTPVDTDTPGTTNPTSTVAPTDSPQDTDIPQNTDNPQDTNKPQNTDGSVTTEEPQGTLTPPVSSETNTPPVVDGPNGSDGTINDSSKLREALEVAATLQESDYTSDSYNALKKAVEEGRTVLANPNSTQEELDAAADNIYNAIGMLVRVNKTSADNSNVTKTSVPAQSVKKAALTEDSSTIVVCIVMAVLSTVVLSSVLLWKRRQGE